jgi:hypothetical protein
MSKLCDFGNAELRLIKSFCLHICLNDLPVCKVQTKKIRFISNTELLAYFSESSEDDQLLKRWRNIV